MFSNIVVGTEGGPGGRDALALAQHLAAPGATLTLAHVYASGIALVPSVMAWDETEAQKSLDLLSAEQAGLSVQALTATIGAMTPGEGLHKIALQVGADLLVVGSSQQGTVGRILVGDDTRAALNGAPCAVAIAPQGHASANEPFARIGVGYDFSPESALALTAAREIAEREGSEVVAVNAVQLPMAFPRAPIAFQPDLLEHAQVEMAKLQGVTGTAELGDPRQSLCDLAQRVDLLVVGSRSYGPLRRMLFGSTSRYLQRHAACPLLVLPRGTHEPQPGTTAASATARVTATAQTRS